MSRRARILRTVARLEARLATYRALLDGPVVVESAEPTRELVDEPGQLKGVVRDLLVERTENVEETGCNEVAHGVAHYVVGVVDAPREGALGPTDTGCGTEGATHGVHLSGCFYSLDEDDMICERECPDRIRRRA